MCSVAQSWLTLSDSMDYSPPDFSVHGVSQARILEWVAISFSRGSSRTKDQTHTPALQMDSLLLSHWGSLQQYVTFFQMMEIWFSLSFSFNLCWSLYLVGSAPHPSIWVLLAVWLLDRLYSVASVVSNSLRPHGLQPTRLPCPWDSPGKSTGVGCHYLLQSWISYVTSYVCFLMFNTGIISAYVLGCYKD